MQTHSPSNFAFDMSQTDDFYIVPFVDSIFSYCFATSTLSTFRQKRQLREFLKWYFVLLSVQTSQEEKKPENITMCILYIFVPALTDDVELIYDRMLCIH